MRSPGRGFSEGRVWVSATECLPLFLIGLSRGLSAVQIPVPLRGHSSTSFPFGLFVRARADEHPTIAEKPFSGLVY